jgi:hypothetical protein
MRLLPPLVVLLCALACSRADAQQSDPRLGFEPPVLVQPPRTGIPALAVAAGLLGEAALNLALLPVCHADWYPSDAEEFCVVSSYVFAGVGIAVGVPSLIIGLVRYRRHQEWKARKRGLALLEPLGMGVVPKGAVLRLELRF